MSRRALKCKLVRMGKWIGAGRIIVFVRQDMSDEQNKILLLHEATHLVLSPKPIGVVELSEVNLALSLEEHRVWSVSDQHIAHMPRWVTGDHGKEFTRIALHIWCAALAGSFLWFDGLCAGRVYDMSPAITYWPGIGNEPIKMQHATFEEILATEMPREFVEIWKADLDFWMKNNRESVEIIERENRNVA